MKPILIIILLSYFISLSLCNLKETVNPFDIITSYIKEKEVGKKGSVGILTEFYDEKNIFDKTDIEEKTIFNAEILDTNQKNYTIDCRLWKAEGINLVIFCNFDENIPQGEYSIYLNNTKINYKDNEFTIYSYTDLTLKKVDKNKANLYSDKQVINVEDGKDSYDLKFKINSYNQEKLFFMKEIIFTYLDKCKVESNELICPISKSRLEEIMSTNEEEFWILYLDSDYNINKLPFILQIKVNYKNIKQNDIYVGITKLLVNCAEHDTFIAYETNVTDISKVFTSTESFSMKFGGEDRECAFRKYEENPLLMVCWGPKENSHLDEIVEEKVLNEINIKYNFRIQPVNNTEMIDSDRTISGSFIDIVNPEVLDFSSQDSLTIEYYLENANSLNGMTFNENAPDLECEDINKGFKKCTVPKSHFKGLESGYYFIKHQNHLNGKSISYEAPPVKVILSDSGSDPNSNSNPNSNDGSNSSTTLIIVLSVVGGIILILLILFLIIHFRKKNSSSNIDTENANDIGLLNK